MIACKDDKVTCPQHPLCAFSGITRTDPNNTTLSEDPDDWCYGSAQEPGLSRAYPNPASGPLTIGFSLPASSEVSLLIMDQNCEIVRTLLAGTKDAGSYVVIWDCKDDSGQDLPTGIYRCLFQAEGFACHGDVQLE
jgi:hypothetical protein